VQEQDPLSLQMRHFVDVVRGDASPILNGCEGTRTLETMLAVKRAAATGQLMQLAHNTLRV
jgi:predicted dehydrogenase